MNGRRTISSHSSQRKCIKHAPTQYLQSAPLARFRVLDAKPPIAIVVVTFPGQQTVVFDVDAHLAVVFIHFVHDLVSDGGNDL